MGSPLVPSFPKNDIGVHFRVEVGDADVVVDNGVFEARPRLGPGCLRCCRSVRRRRRRPVGRRSRCPMLTSCLPLPCRYLYHAGSGVFAVSERRSSESGQHNVLARVSLKRWRRFTFVVVVPAVEAALELARASILVLDFVVERSDIGGELTGRVNTQYAAPDTSWPVSSAAVSSAKPTTSKATTSSQSPSQPSGTCTGCLGAQCDGRTTVCNDGLTCSNASCNWG
jgi:hypothetical protein